MRNVFAGSPDTLPPVGAGNNRDGGVSVAGFVDPCGANANGGLTVTSLSRSSGSVFDAVFLEFDVPGVSAPEFNAVVSNGAGGTGTFAFNAKSVPVDLGTPTPVLVPAALPLLAAGLGVFGLIARRKARAAA